MAAQLTQLARGLGLVYIFIKYWQIMRRQNVQSRAVFVQVRGANPTLYARKKLSGLFEKFPKVQLEKKRGGDSAPGCRASKLLDFIPLLHLFLEAVSLRPGTCWLFILRMHFHIGSGQCIVSLDFHFL